MNNYERACEQAAKLDNVIATSAVTQREMRFRRTRWAVRQLRAMCSHWFDGEDGLIWYVGVDVDRDGSTGMEWRVGVRGDR